MGIIKYLCEFFFCHFWHWFGLLLIIAVIFGRPILHINTKNKEDRQ